MRVSEHCLFQLEPQYITWSFNYTIINTSLTPTSSPAHPHELKNPDILCKETLWCNSVSYGTSCTKLQCLVHIEPLLFLTLWSKDVESMDHALDSNVLSLALVGEFFIFGGLEINVSFTFAKNAFTASSLTGRTVGTIILSHKWVCMS